MARLWFGKSSGKYEVRHPHAFAGLGLCGAQSLGSGFRYSDGFRTHERGEHQGQATPSNSASQPVLWCPSHVLALGVRPLGRQIAPTCPSRMSQDLGHVMPFKASKIAHALIPDPKTTFFRASKPSARQQHLRSRNPAVQVRGDENDRHVLCLLQSLALRPL